MNFDFARVVGFEWDAGNLTKNLVTHGITNEEAEEIFFRRPVLAETTRPRDQEKRWFVIGPSEEGRIVRAVFTVRNRKIRIISARVASRKERQNYEKALRETGPQPA